MPAKAKARQGAPKRKLNAREAREEFPRLTPVARYGDAGYGQAKYVRGYIQGYIAPRWSAAYEDDILKNPSATEVEEGIMLYRLSEDKVLEPAVVDKETGEFLDAELLPQPLTEAEISGGRLLRLKWKPTGWCNAKIVRLMKGPHYCNKSVLKVQHEGDSGPRSFEPARAAYSRSGDAPFDSCHLTKREVQAERAMASSVSRKRKAEQESPSEGE